MNDRRSRAAVAIPPREFAYLRLKGLGQTHEQIADSLGISLGTVRMLCDRTHKRLGVTNAIDAFRVLGWLRVP